MRVDRYRSLSGLNAVVVNMCGVCVCVNVLFDFALQQSSDVFSVL